MLFENKTRKIKKNDQNHKNRILPILVRIHFFTELCQKIYNKTKSSNQKMID